MSHRTGGFFNTTDKDNAQDASIAALQSAIGSSIAVYNPATTYVAGGRCLHNGIIFQATGTTTASPPNYLFTDDYASYCDGTQLAYATFPYSVTNMLANTGFYASPTVFTSGAGIPYLSGSGNTFVTHDFTGKGVSWSADINVLTYSSPGVDLYWALPTVANGNLAASFGNSAGSFAIQAGQLTGGATANVSVDGNGAWIFPVNGDILRFTKVSSTQATIRVSHLGVLGNTATFTLTGATFADTFWSLGINGHQFRSITAVADVSEYSKPWVKVNQPTERVVLKVGAPAGTLDATTGRFFLSPGNVPANSVSAVYTLSNKYIVPGSRLLYSICENGTQTLQGVSLNIREIGYGMFRMYLSNNTSAGISPNLAVSFQVSWPLSLT